MKNKNTSVLIVFAIAIAVMVLGFIKSVGIFKDSNLQRYPGMIANAYRGEKYNLELPGSKEVNLTRIGAYGIYYESNLVSSIAETVKIPPPINCSLTSLSSGKRINAVQDYVPSNQYWSKESGGTGVLVMSISVDKADQYTFACHYKDGSEEPQISVVLGPNYVWEFFRVTWKIILPLLGGATLLCGSLIIGIIFIIVAVLKQLTGRRDPLKQDIKMEHLK